MSARRDKFVQTSCVNLQSSDFIKLWINCETQVPKRSDMRKNGSISSYCCCNCADDELWGSPNFKPLFSNAILRYRYGSTLPQAMAWCLTAPDQHPNRCWLSSMRSCGIHMRTISQEMLKICSINMGVKNTNFRLQPHQLTLYSLNYSDVQCGYKMLFFWCFMVHHSVTTGARDAYLVVEGHQPGPLFTKQTDVLRQDLAKSRSREIQV